MNWSGGRGGDKKICYVICYGGLDLLLRNVMEGGEGVKKWPKLCYVINEWPLSALFGY